MRKGQSKKKTEQGRTKTLRPITVDTETAAELLGVSKRTLANWRSGSPRQGPPFARMGSKVVYFYDDLVEYAESCRV